MAHNQILSNCPHCLAIQFDIEFLGKFVALSIVLNPIVMNKGITSS